MSEIIHTVDEEQATERLNQLAHDVTSEIRFSSKQLQDPMLGRFYDTLDIDEVAFWFTDNSSDQIDRDVINAALLKSEIDVQIESIGNQYVKFKLLHEQQKEHQD